MSEHSSLEENQSYNSCYSSGNDEEESFDFEEYLEFSNGSDSSSPDEMQNTDCSSIANASTQSDDSVSSNGDFAESDKYINYTRELLSYDLHTTSFRTIETF